MRTKHARSRSGTEPQPGQTWSAPPTPEGVPGEGGGGVYSYPPQALLLRLQPLVVAQMLAFVRWHALLSSAIPPLLLFIRFCRRRFHATTWCRPPQLRSPAPICLTELIP